MTYMVTTQVEAGHWVTVAAFTDMASAVDYAKEKTLTTKQYHLVEVKDGGKH